MVSKITTNAHRVHSAKQVIESIDEPANTAYYLFISNHDPNAEPLADIYQSFKDTVVDPYNGMIAGKRVGPSDVKLAIRNVPYVTSTIYDMYDDQDVNLESKDYFVITDEGSYKHVYKCLDNNNRNPSTIEPNFSHIVGSNSYVYQTSDGYRWKYMYSVTSSMDLKFSTSSYFPIFANATVEASAQYGSVDIIKVEGQGQKYDNYVTGVLSSAHIEVGGNGVIYEVSNVVASTFNDFYNGCLMYITSGPTAGKYIQINDYVSNSSGKFVVLDEEFVPVPTNGSEFQIYPRVDVVGSGTNMVNCVARALVNSFNTNSIFRIEILNRGSGYTHYASANAYAHPTVGVSLPAELRIISPPPGGHGANSALELSCNSLMFSVKLANNEGGTVPAMNEFKQIGILKDPLYANVGIEFASMVGTFLVDEPVVQIKPVRVATGGSVSTGANTINSTSGLFLNQFTPGDNIFLVANDSLDHQLATVTSITDDTSLTIQANASFLDTNAAVYITNIYSNGYFISANATHLAIANLHGQLATGDKLIGMNSGAYAEVSSTRINEVDKGFDTFVQMYKYVGALNTGSLNENEWVYQSNTLINHYATGLVHSTNTVGANTTVYLSSQNGEFKIGGANSMIGNSSGSSFVPTEKYAPELVVGSGHTLFLENVDAVQRSNTTSETFKILLSF